MRLPKCVALDHLDPGPAGWRHVGTRVTYGGYVRPHPDHEVWVQDGEKLSDLVSAVNFSGRLWRDDRIDALSETKKWLKGKDAWVVGSYPAAFAVFSGGIVGTVINLIGVHPAAAGLGLAERLIRHVGGTFTAGTYEDNAAARRLYEKLGMKEFKREEVFHEN